MKAAANGVLNCSILDGWWDEAYTPEIGWAIGRGESYDDLNLQDHVESNALYNLLKQEIVPLFYDRGSDTAAWLDRQNEEFNGATGTGVQHASHASRIR